MGKHPYTHKPRRRLWGSRKGPRQLPRDGSGTPDPWVGVCPMCDAGRNQSQCRQEERDEVCVHVCRDCGSIVDESQLPF